MINVDVLIKFVSHSGCFGDVAVRPAVLTASEYVTDTSAFRERYETIKSVARFERLRGQVLSRNQSETPTKISISLDITHTSSYSYFHDILVGERI